MPLTLYDAIVLGSVNVVLADIGGAFGNVTMQLRVSFSCVGFVYFALGAGYRRQFLSILWHVFMCSLLPMSSLACSVRIIHSRRSRVYAGLNCLFCLSMSAVVVVIALRAFMSCCAMHCDRVHLILLYIVFAALVVFVAASLINGGM